MEKIISGLKSQMFLLKTEKVNYELHVANITVDWIEELSGVYTVHGYDENNNETMMYCEYFTPIIKIFKDNKSRVIPTFSSKLD